MLKEDETDVRSNCLVVWGHPIFTRSRIGVIKISEFLNWFFFFFFFVSIWRGTCEQSKNISK